MDIEDLKKMFGPIEENKGEVFYDKRYNRLFQVRGVHDDYLLCGDFCKYYKDAKTNVLTQKLSWNYLKGCIKIKNLDEHPDVLKFNGYGWRVKKNDLL